jgi:decaprenyl-phosphate phosphoribosyltransferase
VSLAYSLRLKRVSIVDVFIISLGFVLRVQAGAVLIDIEPSAWIIIMTGLLTLFIALGKRRDDLVTGMDDAHRSSLRGYTKGFLDASVTAVLGALMVAYLIYTTDAGVAARLGDDRLYYTAPFVLMGILRYLQVTMVEERSGSPTRIALTDRFMVSTMLAWAGVFAWRIYA